MPGDEELTSEQRAERLRSAELVHEQAEYLLNDEIGYAAALRDSRKTASGLLAIMIGVGIFRIDLYRSADHVLAIGPWWAIVVRACFVLSVVFVAIGAFLIFTERNPFRKKTSINGAALSILFLKPEIVKQLHLAPPHKVLRIRTEGLRLAYTRLRDSNRRIRRRIESGTACVLVGVFFVLLGFVLYTVAGSP